MLFSKLKRQMAKMKAKLHLLNSFKIWRKKTIQVLLEFPLELKHLKNLLDNKIMKKLPLKKNKVELWWWLL